MKHSRSRITHSHILVVVLGGLVVGSVMSLVGFNVRDIFAKGGSDEFGYNYGARLFQGAADGVDKSLDNTVWGDPLYAKDHLVMKWSKAWDDARFSGVGWTCDAWETNEWNGKVPGGSGEVWHYKIVWVGPGLEKSPCWASGGYAIWGEFEVIMSQGSIANKHFWEAHAVPTGF